MVNLLIFLRALDVFSAVENTNARLTCFNSAEKSNQSKKPWALSLLVYIQNTFSQPFESTFDISGPVLAFLVAGHREELQPSETQK